MLNSVSKGMLRLKAPSIKGMWEQQIAKFLFALPLESLVHGQLKLHVLGRTKAFVGKENLHLHAELNIHNPIKFYWLIMTKGELGFAHAYLNDYVSTSSLYDLMKLIQTNRSLLDGVLNNNLFNGLQLIKHKLNHNSKANSKKNIHYHYDLGNEFYLQWLDGTMSYSSAVFSGAEESFESAQENKYQRLVDQMGVEPCQKVLEVGCGWGGMMSHLLKRNVDVKGLTLSHEQKSYAEQRLINLDQYTDSDAKFEVAFQDYRDESQTYDHIVSIEMFEAVGKAYWKNYFEMLDQCLSQAGSVGLQIITIDEAHAESYQSGVDFIQAYIFPGGLLPSVTQVSEMADAHGFEVVDLYEFGDDYAKTCSVWKQSFNRASKSLIDLGYDHKFQKTWNYYLDYCIVGFESKHISVHQFVLKRKPSAA